jgi:aminoglycoside 3-N-acetyltransferase
MPEEGPTARTVAAGKLPATRGSLAREVADLGVRKGGVVIAHTAMGSLGYVVGGAQAVVEALLDAVGPDGTLVMPAFSGDRGDPAPWRHPPVPEHWWALMRAEMPAFEVGKTPSVRLGVVAECFRTWPGTLRSDHPSCSFCARGPAAEAITASHPISYGFGETSPLARLYERGAQVLLLGVTHMNDSSLHLAEFRAKGIRRPAFHAGAPVLIGGVRRWVVYDEFDYDNDEFEALGEDFARETGLERRGPVGIGTGRLCEQRDVVDYGVRWLERHRAADGPGT